MHACMYVCMYAPPHTHTIYLVGGFNHLENISRREGLSHILWQKTCSKPPTKHIYIYTYIITIYIYMYICTHTHTYIYIYMCVCNIPPIKSPLDPLLFTQTNEEKHWLKLPSPSQATTIAVEEDVLGPRAVAWPSHGRCCLGPLGNMILGYKARTFLNSICIYMYVYIYICIVVTLVTWPNRTIIPSQMNFQAHFTPSHVPVSSVS